MVCTVMEEGKVAVEVLRVRTEMVKVGSDWRTERMAEPTEPLA